LLGYLLTKFDAREKEAEEDQAAYQGTTIGLLGRGKSKPMKTSGLMYYDRKYVKPFLTTYKFEDEGLIAQQAQLPGMMAAATAEEEASPGSTNINNSAASGAVDEA
jgi:hypothetical protein